MGKRVAKIMFTIHALDLDVTLIINCNPWKFIFCCGVFDDTSVLVNEAFELNKRKN